MDFISSSSQKMVKFPAIFSLICLSLLPTTMYSQNNPATNSSNDHTSYTKYSHTLQHFEITKESLEISNQTFDKGFDANTADARGGNRKPPPLETPLSQFDIAAMQGVKIFTDKDGWYFVSSTQLQANGFDTNSDSTKWQMYSEGIQVPIKVNVDNSIEFYGIGDDTLYTNSKVYYLISASKAGLRIPQIQNGTVNQTPDIQNFQTSVQLKPRTNYLAKLLNGENENWFGSIVNFNGTTSSIDLEKLDTNGDASLRVKLQGLTSADHLVNVQINDYQLGTISYTDLDNYSYEFNFSAAELNEGVNQVTFQSVGAGSDFSLVDSIDITYPKTYSATGDKLQFNVPGGQTVRIDGFSASNINLYEIVDGKALQQVLVTTETVNGTVGFSLSSSNLDREFIAISTSNIETPYKVEQNTPSSWNQSSNSADFIIISPAILKSQAQTLATRRNNQRLRTNVVLIEDIADEYGFGIITPEAIREFLSDATTSWSRKPTYVLLFGDSSFDMRNYLGGESRNLVPTKLIETFDMETSSDGWLVDFDDDGIENIAIGRIPAGNTAEASKAISKIIRYETQNLSAPKSALLNADFLFETLNSELDNLLPQGVSSERIERASLSDAQMRANIIANANANPTFVSYLGHGTTGVWSTGNVFGVPEAESLTNDKLSFYMLMTCLNGYTHNAYAKSLAEGLVLADNGAIAVWASSGSTYASGQIAMGQEVVKLIFKSGKKAKRIGDVVLISKQLSGDWDARRTWQLMGDPTMYIE